ncbi:RsmB/NOP family class I SAM-dependent RNA methyltransferase [Paenibacillus flagellatus]|uniref:rRNA cytosine-C5-methyltransferase n=1 Tax=Paenibacillus flagellatus TaxID=2211139 RepID=A0A2V5KAQ5_9BACL|nr:RsmB/NOP family class I SAM-dependent RNA methyltransferase [Paenibacillus flagellatus]PYI56669.1 rRNA cytosine-C5-methyltransferase [Paenibacillus flagellatus]
MTKLPDTFLRNMERLLRDEYPAFLASYAMPREQGVRANGLKLSAETFARMSPFPLEPIRWTADGFYTPERERPGKHPYYHAGLYYIQEPSAMAPVEWLDVRPGDKVLDLCAAPGGKSTQIAAKLQGRGLLVTNDNQPDRVKALAKNIERYGATNAIVLNETPERLAPRMPQFFDKILVDAPCSGEGMFRKDDDMAKAWDEEAPRRYAAMQRGILARAADMLAPGGRLVYSTCTFSPEENEEVVASLLRDRSDFRVVPIPAERGFAHGRPDWIGADAGCGERCPDLAGTARLWPHRLRGEGHFIAVLEREAAVEGREAALAIAAEPAAEREPSGERPSRHAGKGGRAGQRDGDRGRTGGAPKPSGRGTSPGTTDPAPFIAFAAEQLTVPLPGTVDVLRDFVYLVPDGAPGLDGLKAVRPGWFVGTIRGGRFEPSHALAMGLSRDADSVRSVSFAVGDADAIRYLKGETLQLPDDRLRRSGPDVPAKGYCLICVDGYPLGWAKWQNGMLKNEYPPGWRWA